MPFLTQKFLLHLLHQEYFCTQIVQKAFAKQIKAHSEELFLNKWILISYKKWLLGTETRDMSFPKDSFKTFHILIFSFTSLKKGSLFLLYSSLSCKYLYTSQSLNNFF